MRGLGLAARAIRCLDHEAGRIAGRLQLLVDVRTPMNLAVLRPVWSRVHDDPRISVSFTAEDMKGVRAALEADDLRTALLDRSAVRWRRFDLSISADAWNHAPLMRCRSRLNFFHGVAGKYDLDRPGRLAGAGIERFDRIAFINADRLEKWVAAGVVSRDQAVLVGYPKLDDVVNERWSRDEVRAALGLDPAIATVLYAPTFSTAGSLHAAGEAIVDALLGTGCNVIVKLHDRSLVPSVKYTDGINWRGRFESVASNHRFVLAEYADAGPLLAASDLLVTDHSSIGFEFALLDRPVVVFDAPALRAVARIASDKWDLLRGMAEVVGSVDALGPAVNYALTHPGHRRHERAAARELFAYPGEATGRAMTVVYELLAIRPITARGVRHESTVPGRSHTSTAVTP